MDLLWTPMDYLWTGTTVRCEISAEVGPTQPSGL